MACHSEDQSVTLPCGRRPPGCLMASWIWRRRVHGGAAAQQPLAIDDVKLLGERGRELGAVHNASLFAGFTRRWVQTRRWLYRTP